MPRLPLQVLTTPDTPLSCCAWAGGVHARLAVGSAAGWLAVVNMEGEEPDQAMVRDLLHCSAILAVLERKTHPAVVLPAGWRW